MTDWSSRSRRDTRIVAAQSQKCRSTSPLILGMGEGQEVDAATGVEPVDARINPRVATCSSSSGLSPRPVDIR